MRKPPSKPAGPDPPGDPLNLMAAVQAVRQGWNLKQFPDQPILNARSSSYKALHLKDGSVHWIVSLRSAPDQPVVAAIAADPSTGMWYALAVFRDNISYMCDYPPGMVKKKYKQPPMGFAAALPGRALENLEENGSRR